MMEITLIYQDRQATITKPETKYGSNIEGFSELLTMALHAIGLECDGTIREAGDETNK